MIVILKCPRCRARYVADVAGVPSSLAIGDVCGNQDRTGPHPDECSPVHPCAGLLEPESEFHLSDEVFHRDG